MQMSIFSAEERHAKVSAPPDCDVAWMTRAASSCSRSAQLLAAIAPAGWSGKTSLASCPATAGGTLEPSSGCWQNSGMGSPTEFLTLNSSEFNHTLAPCHSDDGVCSLSDILEDSGSVPQRFYLSATACAGVLRRAERRGRVLPPLLQTALEHAAQMTTKDKPGT